MTVYCLTLIWCKHYPSHTSYNEAASATIHAFLGFLLPFPKQALLFTGLKYKSSSKNNVGKGEIARHKQFLLFPQYFPPFWRPSAILFKFETVVCKLSVWKSLKFVAGKGLNSRPTLQNILLNLLSHITIVKAMVSDERGMNPVALTIINPWKEIDFAWIQISDLWLKLFVCLYSITTSTTRCVCETLMPPKHPSFEKHDPDI